MTNLSRFVLDGLKHGITLELIVKTVFVFLWSIISVYAVDCATKGGCDQYAWIIVYLNTILIVILFIYTFVSSLKAIVSSKKKA